MGYSTMLRPRRRQLEAFTTDTKIIRLISRRVTFFPTAAARQFLDGYYDATNLQKFPGVIPTDLRPCGLLGKGVDGRLPHRQNRAYAITDCLFTVCEVIYSHITQSTYSYQPSSSPRV